MTKNDHIKYWIDTSEKDWNVVQVLFDNNSYVYCLFFAYLSIEKLAKAIWVKQHSDNYPPRSHNIVYLLDDSNIDINKDNKQFLLILNEFNLECRYPDYKQMIFQKADKIYTNDILLKTKEIREWLLSNLQ
jgi:HEPN domain-containing protein